jgi:photosystem II stability/assembly factor-like uncharacterized protein
MYTMRFFIPFLLLITATAQAQTESTWNQPLEVKEKTIEQGIRLRHNIMGLYPSRVQIPRHDGPIDTTTTNPFADIQHAVCWTANYLAGLSYKTAYLQKTGAEQAAVRAARQRADEVFEAVYRCQRITGRRGLQARGYLFGHGETYAERHPSGKLPFWRQGTADGYDFRWVGDPSHHNYSDAIHGLAQYYLLAAEGEQKERAREAIDALVSYWVDNDLNIAKYDRNLPEVPILGLTDGKTLNTRIMMAIAGAKAAHYATGKKKFREVYDRLIEQYGVRKLEQFGTEKDFDDAEHVFCHLDVLFRIEDDPELLAAYRKVAEGLWANHKNDAQSLFTYIYYALDPALRGHDPESGRHLEEALYSLQTFPTDMTIKPRMNSLNQEIKPPYPTYLAAWDNEYLWKSNLLRADGWLSRTVTDVAVSPEDPMVLYAVGEAGGLYQSRDGAQQWQNWLPVDQALHTPVKSVDVGPRSRILAVAAGDGFYLSRTGGESWTGLPLDFEGQAVDLRFDPDNHHVLYAITSSGVYRSRDFGEDYVGQSWECLTSTLPPLKNVVYHLGPGKTGRLYALSGSRLFTRTLDHDGWERKTDIGIGEYAEVYPWFVIDPNNADRIYAGYQSVNEWTGRLSVVQASEDAGATWSKNFNFVVQQISEKGLESLLQLGTQGDLHNLVVDPADPDILYASGDRGVLVSSDGGNSWEQHRQGFSIPLVRSLIISPVDGNLYAGTPAGLYVSHDKGHSWKDAHLWLQFEKNHRHELGGASFIDAYWRGRYYGFIEAD